MKLPKNWASLTPDKLRQTRAVQYLARWIWRELKGGKIPPLRVCAYQISAPESLVGKIRDEILHLWNKTYPTNQMPVSREQDELDTCLAIAAEYDRLVGRGTDGKSTCHSRAGNTEA